MDINKLISLSEELSFSDISCSLHNIANRMAQKDCPIILPLVGEFSAGKTSLINALTDSKQLETATKPTTATIYEIHFGCSHTYAEVKNFDGSFTEVQDISSIKNSEIEDAEYVKVFDTSNRISPNTLLIDTPGLSSSNPRHRQTLVSFLPEADGIILAMDINAQLNRTTIDFIDTISLSGRPVYLILTKCDTKTAKEIDSTVKYIEGLHQIPFRKIAKVSAKNNDLNEMYALLDDIQNDKGEILEKVFNQRIRDLKGLMVERVDSILESVHDDIQIQEAINKQKFALKKTTDKINHIFLDIESDVEEYKCSTKKQFEDSVFSKLDSLVASKSNNFDAEAVSIVNNTATLSLNNLKGKIKSCLSSAVQQAECTNVALSELTGFDMTMYAVEGLSYNLNLNEAGHQYDRMISGGLKIAAAVGAVAVTAGAASAAAGSATASMAVSGGAAVMDTIDTVTDIADTVSDVQSMMTSQNAVQRIEGLVYQTQDKLSTIDDTEANISQRLGTRKGLVDSMVGLVTDSAFGKPQRRRAIHEYMDSSLLPSFSTELDRITTEVLNQIHLVINESLESGTAEMNHTLEDLLEKRRLQKDEFNNRISRLSTIKNEIMS